MFWSFNHYDTQRKRLTTCHFYDTLRFLHSPVFSVGALTLSSHNPPLTPRQTVSSVALLGKSLGKTTTTSPSPSTTIMRKNLTSNPLNASCMKTSCILVVGMKRVVGVWRYVEEVVEVWTPRPRSTVSDSSMICISLGLGEAEKTAKDVPV